jgi:putative colanic acid biosynthesis UDP-glucose lipid carrier transferase
MNFVSRDVGVVGSETLDGFAITSRPGRRWPISYRSVELIAIATDAGTVLLSSVLTGIIYHLETIGAVGDIIKYIGSAAVVLALFISFMTSRDFYKPASLLDIKAQARGVAFIWLGVFLFLAGIAFALKIGDEFSRGAILSFFACGLTCLLVERIVWRKTLQHALDEQKFSGRNVLLITNNRLHAEETLLENLLKHGFQVKHHFVLPVHLQGSRIRERAITQVISYLRGSDIHEVVVSSELARWPELNDLLIGLRKLPLPVSLIPLGVASELLKRPSHILGDTVSIELQRGPLSTFERTIKRAFDIFCAATGLLMLLPLLIATAMAIKLDSPGPIVFRQRRCGFNGTLFHILKFRTMSVLEDGESICQASTRDDRVTRVGKWLRRTSIDELPQLLNVLQGSMSLVGPRPHALAHDNHFNKVVRNYAFRHHVKPGLTGWAQVNGYRGATPEIVDIRNRVEHDLWYINNWSFGLDCLIMARTVFALMRGYNAY